jgi:hypothetical protein
MADEKTSALNQARHRLAAIIVELDAGAAHGGDTLAAARLAPDMLPLSAQVGTVCDMAGQLVNWLGGDAPVDAPRDAATITALKELAQRSHEAIASARPDAVDLAADKIVSLPNGMEVFGNGHDYIGGWLLPNLHFHAAMVHAILRNAGVAIGKRDYMAAIADRVRMKPA